MQCAISRRFTPSIRTIRRRASTSVVIAGAGICPLRTAVVERSSYREAQSPQYRYQASLVRRLDKHLGVKNRCLMPVNWFAEPTKLPDGASGNAWLALDETEPLTVFAGL